MILTAHQPAYLPWLGYFHKIALADTYAFLDNVQFEKNSFTNRNRIRAAAGPLMLTVPVHLKRHIQTTIRDIEIDNSRDWRGNHWKSLYFNYKKAPYFSTYAPFFEDTYRREWKYLSELNEYMLKWFLKELGIHVDYYKASELHFQGAKSDLVLDMCKKLQADTYIFGTLGKDYAKEEDFTCAGIKIKFQEYHHPVYPQLYGDFLPYMSIVDLMFNCGGKSLEILMSGNRMKA